MPKRKLLIAFVVILLLGISFLALFVRQNYVVPILMYHEILLAIKPEYKLSVSFDTFERQMRFLERNRYNVLPLEEVAELIRQKKKIPPRTIAITFDDGYRNNYTYAYPILKKYNLAATIFVIVKEVGRINSAGIHDRVSWNEIKRMQDSGLIFFGSHALGPDPLTKIESEGDLKREIFGSKKILEEKLSSKITMFSYPEGRFNEKIRQLVVDAGYKLAVTTSPARRYPNDDVFALKRIRISENARNLFVFWFETSGFYTFFKERRHK